MLRLLSSLGKRFYSYPFFILPFFLLVLLRCHRGIADPEERRKRKALSAAQGRKAQAAARLLLALCARAGEGRRRVLAELYSALSCHPAADGGSNGVRGSEAIVPRYLGCNYVCL